MYPLLLKLIVIFRGKYTPVSFIKTDKLPTISVLMAAYNEEQIIEKKIDSIFKTNYPPNKIEVFIGSDNSSDNTNSLLKTIASNNKNIHIEIFKTRQGKISIINQLQKLAKGDILVITDANVLLEENTLFELVKFFKDKNVGLVDTHMTNYGLNKTGISFQEKSYISREVYVKHLESSAFGKMIGPFGGCYAIRRELFTPVPLNYLVDDFFICMSVLAGKKKTINSLNAIVREDVSNILKIEFQRKIRIAVGNFQNLKHFRMLLWPPFSELSFAFFSHKVIRWFGPAFLLGAIISNVLLFNYSKLYEVLLFLHLFVTFLPFADFILKKIGIHIVLLRFATHFYTMNLSLFIGLLKSLKGVKSNVWKPTERFQK
jgi:cellulose synthase/poly-beta-1,6-N-acetylglucosamine synthase-like glycosyltransferase